MHARFAGRICAHSPLTLVAAITIAGLLSAAPASAMGFSLGRAYSRRSRQTG